MICPLRLITAGSLSNRLAGDEDERVRETVREEVCCLKERCEWWDDDCGNCVVLSLATLVAMTGVMMTAAERG